MKKNSIKNKFAYLMCFVVALFILSGTFASALEIAKYPDVPGLIAPSQDCTGNDCFSIYVAYWFGLLIYIAGALSLISFTIGAVGLIASAESPEAASNAKDRMKGAVLGLVLTMASFIILRTINLSLVTPSLTPLEGVAGVFYTNGRENKPAPISEANTANIQPGYNSLIYCCDSTCQGGSGPALLIWEYPKPDFKGSDASYGGVKVVRKTCGEAESISKSGSFHMAFETPGIYFFLGSGCTGYMSQAITSSQNQIAEPFNKNIKSVKIINDKTNGIFYGAILHKVQNLSQGGECSMPLLTEDNEKCINVSIEPAASDVFLVNNTSNSSGDGVIFYSEPYNNARRAGIFKVTDRQINPDYLNDADKMQFDYDKIDQPEEYQKTYKTFADKPGSAKIQGNYIVAVYSTPQGNNILPQNSNFYCRTYSKNVSNFNVEDIVASGASKIKGVEIIATK